MLLRISRNMSIDSRRFVIIMTSPPPDDAWKVLPTVCRTEDLQSDAFCMLGVCIGYLTALDADNEDWPYRTMQITQDAQVAVALRDEKNADWIDGHWGSSSFGKRNQEASPPPIAGPISTVQTSSHETTTSQWRSATRVSGEEYGP